jgi:hypothetical protein
MQYALTGFTSDMGFRVYAFDVIDDDRVCTAYTVRADLALVRQYGISLQELPLLCRGVLEQRILINDGEHRLTYTQAEMRIHAEARSFKAEKLKAARKPSKPDRVM